MSRNRFRWRLLRQAILQKKSKAVLVVLAVAMGASVLAALLNLKGDLRYRMNRELRDYGPNVILIPDPAQNKVFLTDDLLPSIRQFADSHSVLSYTPQIFVPVKVDGLSSVMTGASLVSLRKLYPNWKWDEGSKEGVILGSRLAKKLAVNRGQNVEIESGGRKETFPVAGLVEGGESEDDQVFLELSAAQRLSGNEHRFHAVALSAVGEIPDVERDFDVYTKSDKRITYQILRKITVAETQILDKISHLMTLVITIIFMTLFFCIQTTVSAILISRQFEIALFRVLGARRKQIMTELTLELLALGLTGGLLGFVIGIVMAQVLGNILFQTWIVPRFGTFLITIVSSLAMMVIASFWPIRRAINRQAALVLKEA